jgi:outer membrane protein assembly factor BamB
MRLGWITAILWFVGAAALLPAAELVINFRGDPSGGYPDAHPPTRFSATENLTWKAEIGQGCGAAIIVGNRLFVQAAPNALVCLDKATGRELWRRTHHVGQLDPSLPACRLDGAMDHVGQLQGLKQRFRRLAEGTQERTKLEADFERGLAALPEKLPALPGAGINTAGRKDGGGYTSLGFYLICMTPCSDGRSVVAVFPTGIAVAYDLTGRMMWNQVVTPPGIGKRGGPPGILSTCPVMTAEGIVVVRFGGLTTGIEAATGKVMWKIASEGRGCHASPVVGVVGGESFVATDGGDIIRARDGLVIHKGEGPGGDCSVSPVFADGVFHWVPLAVRVTPATGPEAPPQTKVLWSLRAEVMEDLGKQCYGYKYPRPYLSGGIDFTSPVVMDGRVLYYGWFHLNVFDAATGSVIAQHKLPRSNVKPLSRGVTKNWAYGGMVRAGAYLIVIHDNGLVKFLPINDTYSPIKACALPDDVYAQPACDGPALYIRSLNALWRFDQSTSGDAASKQKADE